MKIQRENAKQFLQTASQFGYIPHSVKQIKFTPNMVAIAVTYYGDDDRFAYLEFNHDGRYGLMLNRVQTISDSERDESFYFKSFESNNTNYRKSIVKIYEHLNS